MNDLTQKEAAAALGVSVRQFVRYRRRYPSALQPVALTGLVPVFTRKQVDDIRALVAGDKLRVLAALSAARRGRRRRGPRVVSMAELRAARRKGAA